MKIIQLQCNSIFNFWRTFTMNIQSNSCYFLSFFSSLFTLDTDLLSPVRSPHWWGYLQDHCWMGLEQGLTSAAESAVGPKVRRPVTARTVVGSVLSGLWANWSVSRAFHEASAGSLCGSLGRPYYPILHLKGGSNWVAGPLRVSSWDVGL
jgi:hypothetical protein